MVDKIESRISKLYRVRFHAEDLSMVLSPKAETIRKHYAIGHTIAKLSEPFGNDSEMFAQ